ncbi:MAG: type II secretion system F family protein [Lachnospiraceae bacterium]|nr:type II secretion system F family protein [Lachnospiraceae bacterium]
MAKKQKVIIPEYINSPLNNPMPNYCVYKMKPAEKLLVGLIMFAVGGFVGLIFYSGLFKVDGEATTATYIANIVAFTLVGLIATKFFLPIYNQRCLKKKQARIKQQFRDMLESLTASFSSGSNVQNAFESAAADLSMQYNENEYIVLELNEIINGIKQNINVEVMLENFGIRSGNEDIVSFADVFSVCYRKGGDMNSVIHRTHSVISEKMAIADEIETKLTANKMQHNVMSIMPIVVVAMLKFTNDTFAKNFATVTGVLVNTVAIGIFIGAYVYGNKIVDIKE